MVQKLRHLWGRVEIRVLALLVFGFLLAGLALAVAQLTKSSTDEDPNSVSSWDDLIKKYLEFRVQNYALVVPNGVLSSGSPEAVLKEYSLKEVQEEPDWYWNFDGDVYVFDDDSPLAKQVKPGTRIMIYEDMVKQELVVLSAPEKEGGDYREEIVYRAPEWAEVQKGEDSERYLWRELSQRQIVWQVTLKSKIVAEKEAAEAEATQSQQKDSGEGGGMMLMMGREDYSNHLWVSIRGPEAGLTNLEIAAHIPSGFTNAIEIFTCTNLLDSWWTLAETNVLTEGTDTVYWTYQTTEAKTGPVYVTIGNAVIDSDNDGIKNVREKFLYHTNPSVPDTDGDGLPDGWELQNGLNPLSSQGNDGAGGDLDGDGLSNIEEWTVSANPWQYDTVLVLGPDDLYGGTMLRLLGPGQGIQYRSLSTSRSKYGFPEYCNSSQPPKYYLIETGSRDWYRTSYPNVNYPIGLGDSFTEVIDWETGTETVTSQSYQTYAHLDGSSWSCFTLHWNPQQSRPFGWESSGCDTGDWQTVQFTSTSVYKYFYEVEDAGWYLDCSGCYPGPGFRQETHQYSRSSEYTTGMLLANGAGDLTRCGSLADLDWGEGRNWNGSGCETGSATTAALKNLSTNEDQIALTRIGYRFRVANLETGQIYRLNWAECFAPEGGSTATVLRTFTTIFRGTGGIQALESADYTIDPPETDGVIEPVVLNVPKVDIRVDDSDPNSCYLNTVDSVDHVVTIKGAGDVILRAILDPDTPEIRNQLTWEGAVQQADKITAKISRSATVKHVVHANVGGNASREGNIWVVWTQIDTLNTTGPTPSDSGVDPFSIPGVPPFDYGASGNYGTVPGVDNRFQNGILLRGTILPTSFSNRNGLVQFRFIRTKEKCGWAKWHDTGWAQRPPGYVSPGEPDGPSDVTEDLIPSSQDHIYNVDGPGISGTVDLWDEAVHRVNLSQHIEILLPCRVWTTCSDDVEWFSTVWIEKGADGNFHRRSTENAIGAGHITVGSGSEPP